MKIKTALMTSSSRSIAILAAMRISNLFLKTPIIPGNYPMSTLLRALATYTAGPYIKTNIIEATTSLQDEREEVMRDSS